MQQVLSGLNSEEGLDYVSVDSNDVLIFSHSLKNQMAHLKAVLKCLGEAGLKLKPTKCSFV